MTPLERADLRDRIARRRVDIALAPPVPVVAVDLRAEAGRAALAAMHEAERRARTRVSRRRRSFSSAEAAAVPARVVPVVPPDPVDIASTLRGLARLAGESAAGARLVAALPPLDLFAVGVDPVDHVSRVAAVAANARRPVHGLRAGEAAGGARVPTLRYEQTGRRQQEPRIA